MIKINLYDYREELKRISIQKHVLKSASIVAAALFMILFSWLIEKSRISAVDMEVKGLQRQVNSLQGTVNLVKTMQAKRKRVGGVISGIETLRIDQLPATQILFDVNMGLPRAVWLTKVMQMNASDLSSMRVPTILIKTGSGQAGPGNAKGKKKPAKEFLEVTGYAMEDQSVARFVEGLEEIPYFETVFLFKTERITIGDTPVQKFSIYCYMPANPNKTAA